MTTDPRALPPETLAAIAEPITLDTVRAAFALLLAEDPHLSLDDALEAAWIARGIEVETLVERLTEAEREIDRLVNKLQCPANGRDDA